MTMSTRISGINARFTPPDTAIRLEDLDDEARRERIEFEESRRNAPEVVIKGGVCFLKSEFEKLDASDLRVVEYRPNAQVFER